MNQKYFLSVVFWQREKQVGHAHFTFSPKGDLDICEVLEKGKYALLEAYCNGSGAEPSSILVQAIAFNKV